MAVETRSREQLTVKEKPSTVKVRTKTDVVLGLETGGRLWRA
jgi:hypothetical protein